MSEPNKEIVRSAFVPAPNNTSLSSRMPAAPVEAILRDSALGQPGLKKETARLAILPKPPIAPSPALNSTQTSPLPVHPALASGSIPRSFSWVVFGLAALIFLIQIFNYVVS